MQGISNSEKEQPNSRERRHRRRALHRKVRAWLLWFAADHRWKSDWVVRRQVLAWCIRQREARAAEEAVSAARAAEEAAKAKEAAEKEAFAAARAAASSELFDTVEGRVAAAKAFWGSTSQDVFPAPQVEMSQASSKRAAEASPPQAYSPSSAGPQQQPAGGALAALPPSLAEARAPSSRSSRKRRARKPHAAGSSGAGALHRPWEGG